jgi:hypothetical protein
MEQFRTILVMATLATAAAMAVGSAAAAERLLRIAQASPAPAPAARVLASSEFSDNPDLRCDLLEVKRVSGALLIRFRITNTATSGKEIPWRSNWPDFYFVDPAENKKYMLLSDAAGHPLAEIHDSNYAPGEKRVFWAKFPTPPATSTKISVTIGGFSPFDDTPVGP